MSKLYLTINLNKIILFLFIILNSFQAFNQETIFKIHLEKNKFITKSEYSGRLIILLNSDTTLLPLYWPNISDPQPAFAINVKNLSSEREIVINNTAEFWITPINELDGFYSVSVLFDIDTTFQSILAPGNLVSEKQVIKIKKGQNNTFNLKIMYSIQPYPFTETPNIKELNYKSEMLTSFYNSPTYITGAIILPVNYYTNPDKEYPVVFVFPGWGGNRFHIVMGDFQQKRYGMNGDYGKDKIFVFMDQDCRYGYHVFADSENNGPRASSFIKEFIPYLENNYRMIKGTRGRYLTGQSSGGWAAIWLQVNYPETFNGAWIASPDPIDFRYFENYGNIYDAETNFYFDEKGNEKPKTKKDKAFNLTNREYVHMEVVYGEGYQIGSYESVFGKKDIDGKPEKVFNRKTGQINLITAKHWEKYDIAKILENMDSQQLKAIDGKIHLFVSNDDDYFLDLGVKGLKSITDKKNLNIEFLFMDGLGHNVWTDELRKKIHHDIDNLLDK